MKFKNFFCVIVLCSVINTYGMYRATIIKKSVSSIPDGLAAIAMAIENFTKEQEKLRILEEKKVLISQIKVNYELLSRNHVALFDNEQQLIVSKNIIELLNRLNK